MYLLTFYLTQVNVLINVTERRFHLNNVNFYVKNHRSVNTNGKGFRLRGRETARLISSSKIMKGARESRKGNLKGIGSHRKKRKGWIGSRRKIRKGNLKGIESGSGSG